MVADSKLAQLRDRERPPEPRPCAEIGRPAQSIRRVRNASAGSQAALRRKRDQRQRERAGVMLVTIGIDEEMIEALAAAQFIDFSVTDNKVAVGEAVQRLLKTVCHA